MVRTILTWVRDRSGATAIEYGFIAAGIALAISVFIFVFGDELYDFMDNLTQSLDGET